MVTSRWGLGSLPDGEGEEMVVFRMFDRNEQSTYCNTVVLLLHSAICNWIHSLLHVWSDLATYIHEALAVVRLDRGCNIARGICNNHYRQHLSLDVDFSVVMLLRKPNILIFSVPIFWLHLWIDRAVHKLLINNRPHLIGIEDSGVVFPAHSLQLCFQLLLRDQRTHATVHWAALLQLQIGL